MNDRPDDTAFFAPPWDSDPGGSSIVDLAGAIAGRFGARPLDAKLDPRLAAALADARQVVLLLFDGFGERQLRDLAPGGALDAARRMRLRSVFPSSTGPAITSLATALHPASHANTGWFCWSEELEAVVRTLVMDLRGVPGSRVDAAELWSWQSPSLHFDAPVFAIQPQGIADSTFSRHAWAAASRVGYRALEELPELIDRALRESAEGAFVWVYLPHFDSISHACGWQSDEALAIGRGLDLLFETLAVRLRASGALLLATADHGFVDVPVDSQLRLEDFPELAALLDRPLSGEPRVAYCHARPGHDDAFEAAARSALGFAFDVVPSERLVRCGWFGPGPVSPQLAGRIGTHTLIARERYTLVDRMPGERPARFVGMHGGIDPDELFVPLAAMRHGSAL